MPDDELAHTGVFAFFHDDRLAVAGLGIRIERAPDFSPGRFVEGHDLGVSRAAHQADQPVAIYQRSGSTAPGRNLGAVFFDVVFLPEDFARVRAEAEQIALRTHDIDTIAVDRW